MKKVTKKTIEKYVVWVGASAYSANESGYVGVKGKYRTLDLKFAKLFSKKKAMEKANSEHNRTIVNKITIASNNRRTLKEEVFSKRDNSLNEIDFCNQNRISILFG